MLISSGAKVNKLSADRASPLHIAAQNGDFSRRIIPPSLLTRYFFALFVPLQGTLSSLPAPSLRTRGLHSPASPFTPHGKLSPSLLLPLSSQRAAYSFPRHRLLSPSFQLPSSLVACSLLSPAYRLLSPSLPALFPLRQHILSPHMRLISALLCLSLSDPTSPGCLPHPSWIGFVNCVEALIAANADLSARFQRQTPLGIAQLVGNQDMIRSTNLTGTVSEAFLTVLRDELPHASLPILPSPPPSFPL